MLHLTYPDSENRCRFKAQEARLWVPSGVSWAPIKGGKPLRYIYIDEAGTSAQEPTTIVAGIIVDADSQYVAVEQKVAELLQTVPEQHRNNPEFIPHAKSIFHGEDGLREGWDRADRRAFITRLIAIAPQLGIPVCIGLARRTTPLAPGLPISLLDHHHMLAFSFCIAHADRYIVECGRPEEVATLVAENIPERERQLSQAFQSIKEKPISLNMEHGSERSFNPDRMNVTYTVTRIRDTPHFVAKWQNSLLWIADACAFAYARHLSGGSFGAELVRPIRVPQFDAQWADPGRLVASLIVGGPRQQPINKPVRTANYVVADYSPDPERYRVTSSPSGGQSDSQP
jgi:hypothetical protein